MSSLGRQSFYSDFVFEFRYASLGFILLNFKATGFSNIVTFIPFQTSDFVGSSAIFSAIPMSSGRTEPKTVYEFFHSWWFARLIKNSGPEPTHATEPLLIKGHTSLGISLKVVPWASSVPWINPNGGPKGAWEIYKRNLSNLQIQVLQQQSLIYLSRC